jgi:hypothetical protein
MCDGVRVVGGLRDVFRIYLIRSGGMRDAILHWKSSESDIDDDSTAVMCFGL